MLACVFLNTSLDDFPLANRPEKAADIEEIPSDRRVTTQIWVMPLIC